MYLEVLPSQSAKDAERFMKRVIDKAPFKIKKVLTDNGKSFTDRFTAGGERKPTGNHLFDLVCEKHSIEHRLIRPGRPQTNGMVERFNGRISDVLATRRYDSSEDLEHTLKRYCWAPSVTLVVRLINFNRTDKTECNNGLLQYRF